MSLPKSASNQVITIKKQVSAQKIIEEKQHKITKPYLNVLSQQSKSVATVSDTAVVKGVVKLEPSNFHSLQDSVCSASQSQSRSNQGAKVVKKLTKNY